MFKQISFHLFLSQFILDMLTTSLLRLYQTNFTAEIHADNSINFLKLKICIDNNHLIFDLYSKPTFSGRFLNFYSNHSLAHKRGVIYGLVDKILFLSNQEYHKKNFETIIVYLFNNNYPLKFIFTTINNRIKYHLFKNSTTKSNNNNNTHFCTFSYVKNLSNKLVASLSKYNFKIAYRCNNKLDTFIKTIRTFASHTKMPSSI